MGASEGSSVVSSSFEYTFYSCCHTSKFASLPSSCCELDFTFAAVTVAKKIVGFLLLYGVSSLLKL